MHWLGVLLNLFSIWVLRILLRFGSDRQTVVLGRRLKRLVRSVRRVLTRWPALVTRAIVEAAMVVNVVSIRVSVRSRGLVSVVRTLVVCLLRWCRWLLWCSVEWTRVWDSFVLALGLGVCLSMVRVLPSVRLLNVVRVFGQHLCRSPCSWPAVWAWP